MESVAIYNEMYIKCDWLEFTVDDTLENVIKFLGFHLNEFVSCGRGAQGYKSKIDNKEFNFSILYEGNENMGVHVSITSKGFNGVFNRFMKIHSFECPFGVAYDTPWDMSYVSYFLKSVLDYSKKISRLDVAIDDYTNEYFTVDDVYDLLESERCVSKFKSYSCINSKYMSKCVSRGKTVYLGSKSSDIFLRVYDKALEQKYDGFWVRWEFQLRNKRATHFIEKISRCEISHAAFGLLSNYIRFIDINRSERSKCRTMKKWEKFINNAERIKLYTNIEKRTIEDKMDWVDRQVGPTLAQIMHYDGGDFFFSNMDKWSYKGGVFVE